MLDALRNELRKHDYVPILFDFDRPQSKDFTGTLQTLANMAKFIIADLTDPISVPHELATIVPRIEVPVQPILLEGQQPYVMFADLADKYYWVLPLHRYSSEESLIAEIADRVIDPAEAKVSEIRAKLQNR